MDASIALATQSEPWVMTQDRLDLLKRTFSKGATNDEFAMFINQAERTGLDPFSRQIYSIRRREWDKDTRGYVEKMVTQVSIDGFRLIVERTGKYGGQTPVMWCGNDGIWKDVWLSKEPPAARFGGCWLKYSGVFGR